MADLLVVDKAVRDELVDAFERNWWGDEEVQQRKRAQLRSLGWLGPVRKTGGWPTMHS